MATQNYDDQHEVDFDELDFQSSISDSSFDEPLPVTQARAKKAFKGRKNPRRSSATGSVDEYKAVLLELNSKVTEICSNSELTSEQKTDLIRYASRQAGHDIHWTTTASFRSFWSTTAEASTAQASSSSTKAKAVSGLRTVRVTSWKTSSPKGSSTSLVAYQVQPRPTSQQCS